MTASAQGKTPFRAGGQPRGIPELPTATEAVYLADVSEYQPDVVDASYLAWSKGIIFRALDGTTTDTAWYGGQRRADLHSGGAQFVGLYQYLVESESGASQAASFHSLVGAIENGEVFIADFEEGAHALLTDWYNAMISIYGSGISKYLWTYTGLDFGQAEGALPVQWLADYTSAEPSSPHTLWQFTDSYSVPGVGACDCSVYHGTIDQLAALAYGGTPVPALPTVTGLSSTPWLRIDMSWTAIPGTYGVHYRYQVAEGTAAKPGTVVASETVTVNKAIAYVTPGKPYVWRVQGAGNAPFSEWTAVPA